jgi:putative membrane protein
MRFVNGTGLIVAALVATAGALIFPIWSYSDRSGTGLANLNAETVPTRWGPLSAADRDFIVRVRLAGLWELPAGQQAIERAPSNAVKAAGEHLVQGHTFLDARVREVGANLNMELPNQPNEQQQGWLDEFTAASGTDYETKFANILRLAHGKVFAVVAHIRNSTRNTLVRKLAEDANAIVLDHINMLEDTGRVDFDAIARDSVATTTASPTGPPPPDPDVTPSPAGTVTPTLTLPPAATRPPDPGASESGS